MCNYCAEFHTGNCNDSLITETIKLESGLKLFGVDVFLEDDNLVLFVDNIYSNDTIILSKIPIKYCPMCGQKF